MLSNSKRLAAVAAGVAALSAVVPVASAAEIAPAPCRAAASVLNGNRITVVLAGHYVGKAGDDVTLTCNVIQNGVAAASSTDSLYGHVAVVADSVDVDIAPFQVCYEAVIWNLLGGYRYETNCP